MCTRILSSDYNIDKIVSAIKDTQLNLYNFPNTVERELTTASAITRDKAIDSPYDFPACLNACNDIREQTLVFVEASEDLEVQFNAVREHARTLCLSSGFYATNTSTLVLEVEEKRIATDRALDSWIVAEEELHAMLKEFLYRCTSASKQLDGTRELESDVDKGGAGDTARPIQSRKAKAKIYSATVGGRTEWSAKV